MGMPGRKSLTIRPFRPSDEMAVIGLWRVCELVVPHNDPRKDIARKSTVNPEWFLVGELGDVLIASCMAGYEGHRGWINYLAVHPDHRRCGYAGKIMAEAERLLREAGCPKINLQVRTSNSGIIRFYEKIGFNRDQAVSLGKRLIPD
jgi:ribosomal protein S18 acetylase RimI-like enzyme